MRRIDLRSDTVTQPSESMRSVIGTAAVGDDVYGEDPSVNALEKKAAELTGKQAALFVPSGSMANLIAQMAHVRRGDEVIVGQDSHVLLHETGSGAAVAGVLYRIVAGCPQPTADDVAERIVSGSFYAPATGLVWIENTHNMAGGRVFPLEEVHRIHELCREHALPLHMDGARVFNAAIASGTSIAEIAAEVDSLSFALSKGLGAPAGSVLCGTAAFREKALRLRKMLGGAMRQVGILAAAGLYALEHNVARMAEDHRNAHRLAAAIADHPRLRLDPRTVETNIVMAELPDGRASELAAVCQPHGVLFHALDAQRARFVTHMQITAKDVEIAAAVIRKALDGLPQA